MAQKNWHQISGGPKKLTQTQNQHWDFYQMSTEKYCLKLPDRFLTIKSQTLTQALNWWGPYNDLHNQLDRKH